MKNSFKKYLPSKGRVKLSFFAILVVLLARHSGEVSQTHPTLSSVLSILAYVVIYFALTLKK